LKVFGAVLATYGPSILLPGASIQQVVRLSNNIILKKQIFTSRLEPTAAN